MASERQSLRRGVKMASIKELQGQYEALDGRFDAKPESTIDAGCLLAFDY